MVRVDKSRELFQKAQTLLPGGVNSPVRAFRAVGGDPLFMKRGHGAYTEDEDGNRFLDYLGSWGPLILGHTHPRVVAAVQEQLAAGSSFGAPTRLEVEMAETVTRLVPSVEMVRMVSSGTEATLSALRLARGATRRAKLVKFAGCYHGHADSFLIKAGSGAATFGVPDSPGVTDAVAHDTLVAEFNSLESVSARFAENPGQVAALIVEPVVGNMGVVAPRPGFLQGLREICTRAGALLIFDEVITGFRLGLSGAQGVYAVKPDLTTFGKVIGGGLPVGAYGGRRDLMEQIAPAGPIYQAGTLSGNPLAMAAGLATLREIEATPGFYERLESLGQKLEDGVREVLKRGGHPCSFARVASMWTLFFTPDAVVDWPSADRCDRQRYGRFFQAMLGRGVYLAPAQFEANFLSSAHTEKDVEATVAAMRGALEEAFG